MMIPCRPTYAVIALALALGAGSGCALVGAVADGVADEGPPGAAPAHGGPRGSVADAGDAGAPFLTGSRPESQEPKTSGYLVAPALTWGEMQLYRPHALMGSLFDLRGPAGKDCSRAALLPFEVNGALANAQAARDMAWRGPVAYAGTGIPVELSVRFDRHAAAERAMRTGAFLVQRGPVCAESFFFAFAWTWGAGGHATVATSW